MTDQTSRDPPGAGSDEGLPTPKQERMDRPSRAKMPTRISGTLVGIIVGAFVLVILLVFVLQNTKSVKVSFFAANGHLPLGVALLFAAVGGILLAAVAASLRILQIRRRLSNGPRRAGGLSVPASGSPTLESDPPKPA